MTLEKLTTSIETLDHVVETNLWEKGEHRRLYVRVASQNRFPNNSVIYVDLHTNEVVTTMEKGKSGAKAYAWAQDVAAAVQAIVTEALAMPEPTDETPADSVTVAMITTTTTHVELDALVERHLATLAAQEDARHEPYEVTAARLGCPVLEAAAAQWERVAASVEGT